MMIKKVRLDILEASLTAEDDPSPERIMKEVAEGPEEQPARRSRLMRWMLWAGASLGALLFLAAGIYVTYLGMDGGKTKKAPVKAPLPVSAPVDAVLSERILNLGSFVVDIKDDKGQLRLLMCDIAAEVDPGRDWRKVAERVDVRHLVYQLARDKRAALWESPEARRMIKQEIGSGLNNLLGGSGVRSVFITKLVIF